MQSEGFLQLVGKAQAGDLQAAESLLAAVRVYLDQLAQNESGPSGAEASRSDMVQAASLRVWERLGQFRGADTDDATLAAFQAWLAQILRTSIRNWKRDAGRKRRKPDKPIMPLVFQDSARGNSAVVDPSAVDPTPSTRAVMEEERKLVREAIEAIPDPIAREIIWLRFYEALSLLEIARRRGLAYEEVRRHYRDSLGLLEEKLNGLLRDKPGH